MMINWSDDLRRDPPIWVQIPVLPYPKYDLEGERKYDENKHQKI